MNTQIGQMTKSAEALEERRRLLDDLRRQYPSASGRLREKTAESIAQLEAELSTRGTAR